MLQKSSAAYTEPAVPSALSLPTGVIGKTCNTFIPKFCISSSRSIAFKKFPPASPSSMISLPLISFALNVLKLIPHILALFFKNKDLKSLFSPANPMPLAAAAIINAHENFFNIIITP